jgi:hypothetical protein
MKPAFWGAFKWNDKNFRWGSPFSYILEPGDDGYVADGLILTPTTTTHQQTNTMNTDYIPQSYPNLNAWCAKQIAELTAQLATDITMTPEERASFLAAVTTIENGVSPIVDLMEQLDQLTANFHMILDAQLPIVRAGIKRAKTSAGCTPAIQTRLDWVGTPQHQTPATSRPTIDAEAQRGRVKITGKKPGFDAVNIYSHLKGEVNWKLIAVRKRKFPYYDETPLAVANTPEVREYMAFGVVNDEEIGEMSEIKEVVYAG